MAVTFKPTQALTDEELEKLSKANPGVRFERSAQGELIVTPPVGTFGGFGEMSLAKQLDTWAEHDGSGIAAAPDTGFTLPDGAVFAPDAAWVSRERWKALTPEARKGYARIAPDVAFELLSPSDTMDYMREKAAKYLANGTLLVVLLDPESRSVECHRSGNLVERHARIDAVPLSPELPGFILDAAAVFARMEEEEG